MVADAGEGPGGDAHMEQVDSDEEGSDEMEREGDGGEGAVTEHNITVNMEFSNLPRVKVSDAHEQEDASSGNAADVRCCWWPGESWRS